MEINKNEREILHRTEWKLFPPIDTFAKLVGNFVNFTA